jgi:uncharacterized protein (DUF1697 family)
VTEWVALLRGVNVGGVTIRSAELRDVATSIGLDDARTVLASGNLLFRAAGERGDLTARIEKALSARFDYDARIVLVTRDEVAAAIAGFPFDEEDGERQPYVVFCLGEQTRRALVDAAADLDGEVDPVADAPGVVYWNPAKGTTVSTPFAKVLAGRAYRETTTNRNLRTLRKIAG